MKKHLMYSSSQEQVSTIVCVGLKQGKMGDNEKEEKESRKVNSEMHTIKFC